MNILFFEDRSVDQLHPTTLGRPAYGVTCGAACLRDLATSPGAVRTAVVRDHLAAVQREEFSDFVEPAAWSRAATHDVTLLINARLVPQPLVVDELLRLGHGARQAVVRLGDAVAAAVVRTAELPHLADRDAFLDELARIAETLPLHTVADAALVDYPHDLIRAHLRIFRESIQWQLDRGSYQQVRDGLFVADGVRLPDHFITDATGGPIVVQPQASIGPYAVLHGPLWIGAGARIMEHAVVKGSVSLGHTTKIGGEVTAAIIEPYSNKQHHGFLGHSYVGSWVNLGAGTCNSDLKNTYGQVNMEYGETKVATGMQFMGCIIGDYTKTAVNTSIFTGKLLGVGSMIYGYVTSNVPSFTNYARTFGQLTELAPDVLAETQRRMFQRRQMEQRPYHVELLKAIYALTRGERTFASRPISF